MIDNLTSTAGTIAGHTPTATPTRRRTAAQSSVVTGQTDHAIRLATRAGKPTPMMTTVPIPPSKSALVLKLLSRAKGATIAEIAEPTGWQPHSTRAYLSGLRKKGHQVIREERRSGETSYRIGCAASPADKADVAPADDSPVPAASDAIEANDGSAGNGGAAAPVDAEADAATTPEAAA